MMESLFLLLPLSIMFVLLIGGAFWWAIFSGQFDDLQQVADTVLADDDSTSSEPGGNELARRDIENKSSDIV